MVKTPCSYCGRGCAVIREFRLPNGLVEGIGYRNGELLRYTAGSLDCSPFACESISLREALRWWAELSGDGQVDEAETPDQAALSRFLREAADSTPA